MRLRPFLAIIWATSFVPIYAQPYPSIVTFFSAVEQVGFKEATAYQFDLSCEKVSCTLQRITYDMCLPDKDLKRDVMRVWVHTFLTTDRTMSVTFQGDMGSQGILALKFGDSTVPSIGGEMVLKFDMAIKNSSPLAEIKNLAGTSEKTSFPSLKRSIVSLTPVHRPGQPVSRSCPIILMSLLR